VVVDLLRAMKLLPLSSLSSTSLSDPFESSSSLSVATGFAIVLLYKLIREERGEREGEREAGEHTGSPDKNEVLLFKLFLRPLPPSSFRC
jgi:hypothetical protein